MLLEIAGDTEPVVGIAEIRRNAGARGTAGDFDVVAPGSAPGRAAFSDFGTARVSVGRSREIRRRIPIAAPFVNIFADVVKSIAVGCLLGDGLGAGNPALGIVGPQVRRFVAPRIEHGLDSAAGRSFPFGLGRQAVAAARLFAQPIAVGRGIKPGHTDDRLRWIGERFIVPVGRWFPIKVPQKEGIFGIGDLSGRQHEAVNPNSTYRAFIVET